MAVPRHLRARRRGADRHVLPPADRLSAYRGPGRGEHPGPLAAGRDAEPDARGAAEIENYFRRARIEEHQDALHRRRRRRRRRCGRPEYRPGLPQSCRRGTTVRARRTPPTRSSRAHRAHSATSATRRSSRSCPAPSAASASRAASRWSCRTRAGMTREQFLAARDQLLQQANSNSKLTAVRISDLPDVATYKIDVNQQKLTALGLNQTDINNTLSTAWGGRYVNDFIDKGRVKRVYVQGDAPYRADPARPWPMVHPIEHRRDGALLLLRRRRLGHCAEQSHPLSGRPRVEFQGQPAPGVSSGEAMDEMERWPLKSPARPSPGPASPIRSGSLRPGALALRGVAAGRLPLPRRALRELVDPGRRPAGRTARPGRRDLRGDAARARRTTSICRSACSRRWALRPRMRS